MADLELFECPNCGAPLRVSPDLDLVQCEYCQAQSQRSAPRPTPPAPTGPRLAEAISLEIREDFSVPLVSRGVALPMVRTEVVTTGRDDQDSFEFRLRAGNAELPGDNRMLAALAMPLVQRGPRGTVNVGLTLRVALDGATTITLKEEGQTNSVTRTDFLAVEQ